MGSIEAASSCLRVRDWHLIDRELMPRVDPYAVIDDLLSSESLAALRNQLLNHWAWRYKGTDQRRLFLIEPRIPLMWSIASAIPEVLPRMFQNLRPMTLFSVMHQDERPLGVHADNSKVSVNLWLTPDEYNLDPLTGGLQLFDRQREPSDMLHEYNTSHSAGRFLTSDELASPHTIPYQQNRATVFLGSTLHSTQSISFSGRSAAEYRMNVTILYSEPEIYEAERAPYFTDSQ